MLETAKKAPAAIAERAAAVVDKARNVTPKQAAQAVGGTSGAISGHGTLSAPGAYYGAKTAGRGSGNRARERARESAAVSGRKAHPQRHRPLRT